MIALIQQFRMPQSRYVVALLVFPVFAAISVMSAEPGEAKAIGEMQPAAPLTRHRIMALPTTEQGRWLEYLQQSDRQMNADKSVLAAERHGMDQVPPPPLDGPSGGGGMPLDKPAGWYGSAEAIHVADNIVSFQTPAGGWGKNQDRRGTPRLRGQSWVSSDKAGAGRPEDYGTRELSWIYVGTLDNGATISEIRFLAKVQQQLPGMQGDGYRQSLLRGLDYILRAQMPNGGFPQVYPLQGGYHDAITFNDDALTDVGRLLRDMSQAAPGFEFVDAALRAKAAAAYADVLRVVLQCQIRIHGTPTIWGQQYDALVMTPVGARNFEPASLSTGESAGALIFLMEETKPSQEVANAVEHGIAWLRANRIDNVEWTKPQGEEAKRLVPKMGAGPLWPRFFDLQGARAIFGDRDRTIRDDVTDLIPERRNGYAWYVSAPAKALKLYDAWKKRQSAHLTEGLSR